MKKRIFLIPGMHRSGTSHLANSLSVLGLELPSTIQGSAPDNPKGHFESLSIRTLHDRILQDAGLTWDSLAAQPESWFSSESAASYAEQLKVLLQAEYSGVRPIVLKDPRIALLIPLWKQVIQLAEMEGYFIIPLRHPVAVAESLMKRDKISYSHALMIWLNHFANAEIHTRESKRSFVRFPDWTADFLTTVEKIENDLKTQFPLNEREHLLRAQNEFDPELVHHQAHSTTALKNRLYDICEKVWSTSESLIGDSKSLEAFHVLDGLYGPLREEGAVLGDVIISYRLGREKLLQQELEQSHEELSQSRKQAETLQQKVASLQQELERSHAKCRQIFENQKRQQEELNNQINENFQLRLDRQYKGFGPLKRVYRRIYKYSGIVAKKNLPSGAVTALKKTVPKPSGIPVKFSYKNDENPSFLPIETFNIASPNSNPEPDLLVFSIIDWDFRMQRPQHIAFNLATPKRRVFYFEMRFSHSRTEIREIADNLYRVRLGFPQGDAVEPYVGSPQKEQLAQWIESLHVFCDHIKATAHKQIIIQHPYWWQYARHLSPEFEIIFDCMDDISGFSNTTPALLDLEESLLKGADKLTVSSQYLHEKFKARKDSVVIRNATEIDHFASKTGNPEQLQVLKSTTGKTVKVGYVGAIAEWFDTDLIEQVAGMTEGKCEFHLCGAVTDIDAARLDRLENVHMYGEIPYVDVPAFVRSMDVMTIPFRLLPIIQACDPVKFYEYSAAGKATVSTPLPELERASELVFFAADANTFASQIKKARAAGRTKEFKEKLLDYASMNRWVDRVEQFIEVLRGSPLVSIVILSYGDAELTKATLFSLFDCAPVYPNMEIIVVDNGSDPSDIEQIENFAGNYPAVKVINNGENFGFAKGNNVGLSAASGEYVLLLNNDTVVTSGAIFAMVRHLRDNPSAGVVGPLTNNIGNEAKLEVVYSDTVQMKTVARQVTAGYRGQYTPIKVTAYFAAMFRRKDLERFGLLSEDYGRGMFEDDDHCARIQAEGYQCVLAEDAFIHHHLSATFSQVKDNEKKRLFDRNRRIFEAKWGPWSPHSYRDKRPLSTLQAG